MMMLLLLLMLLLLEAELRVLQLLHLRYRRDRAAVRLAGRVQQLTLRRGVVEGVSKVVLVRLALVLTDCNRKDMIDVILNGCVGERLEGTKTLQVRRL